MKINLITAWSSDDWRDPRDSALELGLLQAASDVLAQKGETLRRAFPALQPDDVEILIQKALIKLKSTQNISKFSEKGFPAGYLTFLLLKSALELIENRRKVRLLQRVKALSEEGRSLLVMKVCRNLTIHEIAAELGITYAEAAARIFATFRQIDDDEGRVLPLDSGSL